MAVNINSRQKKIIEILRDNIGWIISSEIAKRLQISDRTVRNEIKLINQLYDEPVIISLKGKGYSLNSANKNIEEFSKVDDSVRYKIPIKRQLVVLKTILLSKEIDFYELADNIFISETTLDKDISAINEEIQRRNISLLIRRRNNKLYFEGSEESKRKVYLYFLIDEIEEYNFDFNNYSDYFHACNLLELKEAVINFIKDENLIISDLSLISLIIHIAIMLESVSHGNYISNGFNENIDSELVKISNSLYERIKSIIGFNLPSEEIYYIASLFSNKIVNSLHDTNHTHNYYGFIERVINEIKMHYQVDLGNDKQFINNLQLHLSALDKRAQNKKYYNNPLIHDIKKNFPFTYDISVYISLKVQELLNIKLTEDEIGFITLHIMCSVEKMQTRNKKCIAIINPIGKASTNYIAERLCKYLKNPIEIVEVYSLFELEKVVKDKPDLIITTVNINTPVDIPVYKCSSLLKDHEIEEIDKLIGLKENKIEIEKKEILKFFTRDLFFPNMEFESKDEVIRYMCCKLEEHGYVDEKYIYSVLKREEIAPTSFGNLFAIPHPAERIALKNGIAVCILKDSLSWSNHKVKIIFLFSLAKSNMNLNKLYEVLVNVLDDINRVKKIAKIDNYDDFINSLLD